MTDEEFQKLKEAEKEHLRKKKQLKRTLEAAKKRNRLQGIVEQMKRGAGRILAETESLIDTIQQGLAKQDARVEVSLDDRDSEGLHEAEAELRKERADELVRQYKAAQSSASRSPKGGSRDGGVDREQSGRDGPEKTIGRMETGRSKEPSEDS